MLRLPAGSQSAPIGTAAILRTLVVVLVGLLALIVRPGEVQAQTTTVTLDGAGGVSAVGDAAIESTFLDYNAGTDTYTISNNGTINVVNGSGGVLNDAGSGTASVTISPGTGNVSSLTFNDLGADNFYTIRGNGDPVTILNTSGSANNDTISIGTGPGGTMDDIGADVTINYTAPTTTILTLNDASDATADTNITMSATQITGMATGNINYLSTLITMTVNGGSGGNTYTVTNTPALAIVLNLGAGSDTMNVQDTGAAVTLNAQGGANTINLGATSNNVTGFGGNVTMTAAGGSLALSISDSADATARQFTITAPSVTLTTPALLFDFTGVTMTSLAVSGGSGGNDFNVMNTPSGIPTTLNTGSAVDTVSVTAASGTALNLNGVSGADSVTLGSGGSTLSLNGTIGVTNPGGSTALLVNDSADAGSRTVSIGGTSLTGTMVNGATVNYANLSSLQVSGGSGGNAFTLTDTPAAITTTLNLGSGSDSLNAADTGGPLIVAAQAGANTVTFGATSLNVSTFGGNVTTTAAGGTTSLFILDSNDTTPRALSISGTQTVITSPALTFDYTGANLTGLTVAGGSGGNTITVPSTAPAITTVVDSGPSPTNPDNVTVQSVTLGSTLNVNGQAGPDVVTLGNAGSAQGLAGTTNVSNASGATSLTIDNSADGVSRAVTIGATSLTGTLVSNSTVTYANLSALAVSGGGGGNTFTVNTTPAAPTTLNLGGGADVANVADTGQVLTINGQAGINTVILGATDNTITDFDGNVTLTASGGGTTALTIDNDGDATGRTFTLTGTDTTLQSPSRVFTYGGAAVSTLALNIGTGGDVVNVTPAASTSFILTDPIAGAPNDTLNVVTTGLSNTSFTGTPANGGFTATGVQPITYTNFEIRQENGATSGGTFNLSTTTFTVLEAGGNATITVNRTGTTLGTVDVTVTPSNGSATSPADFDPTPRTITFAEGQATGTALIPIVSDNLDEADETVTITLSNPTNGGTLGTQTVATLTIQDDDGTPSVSVSDPAQLESNGTMTFTVTLSAASGQSVSVQYTTGGGNASPGTSCTPGVDYIAATGLITFNPGVTSQPLPVTICPDGIDEANETFTVTISNPTNAILGTSSALGLIQDDDGDPTLSVPNAQQTEGNGGTSMLTFTVTVSPASGQTVSVQYTTNGGNATGGASCAAGVDYQTVSGSLTFSPGETNKPVQVPICGDTVDETDEVFVLTLSSPINAALGNMTATGTILDDDAPTVTTGLNVSNAQQIEGNSGTTSLTFTVTLTPANAQTVTVQYATGGGNATGGASCTSGVDYVSGAGTLTFIPGTTSQPIPVTVCGDATNEPDETFTVTLSNPTNAAVGTGTATGTIVNDDTPNGGPASLRVANAQQPEGNSGTSALTFAVTLSTPLTHAVTVQYTTGGGTATAGASCMINTDYVSASGALTFNPGETSKAIPVTICGDTSDEPSETFTLTLSGATNATISAGIATGTIQDDDGPARVGLGQTQVTRDDEGTGTLTFQIVLADSNGPSPASGTAGVVQPTMISPAASGLTVTVNFTTADGTARANVDYTPTSGTVTFAPGETAKTVSVPLLSSAFRGGLTIQIQLTGAVNAVIDPARSQVTVTIPNLSVPPKPPEIKENKDDVDKPQRVSENEQEQRDHTSAVGPDDLRTEGNVVEVNCDAEIPYVTIVNRDGRMTVLLTHEARQRCGDVSVGSYVEVSGRKQTEQLFEADNLDVSRPR